MQVRWHELELVVAIARAGSATAAAQQLGISQSTVSRHLADLETRVGARLFDRQAHRLIPTAEGAELVAATEQVESSVHATLRRIAGREQRPDGLVRITAHPVIHEMLVGTYHELLAAHARLELELDTQLAPLHVHRGEADIAVRITPAAPEGLFGRKVARFAYGLYRARGRPTPNTVIGYPPPRGDIAGRDWLSAVVVDPRVRIRIGADRLQATAVRAGIGVAQIPCMFGDIDPELERVPGAPIEWGDDLWVLTHQSLRNSARVRVVLDAVSEALVAERARLEGERTP